MDTVKLTVERHGRNVLIAIGCSDDYQAMMLCDEMKASADTGAVNMRWSPPGGGRMDLPIIDVDAVVVEPPPLRAPIRQESIWPWALSAAGIAWVALVLLGSI